MHAAFNDALRRTSAELVEQRLRLCNRTVAVRIVGRALAREMLRPWSHLVVEASGEAPDLRIDLWDESVTGVPRPIRSIREACGVSRAWGEGVLGGNAGDDVVGFHTIGALTLIHRSAGAIVGWVQRLDSLTEHELRKPLQPVLVPWYIDSGIVPLHAGMVARGNSGVLIGGASGSGKTTVTLLCQHAGFNVLGDDSIGLQWGENGAIQGHSIHGSMWLETDHALRFPWLPSPVGNAWGKFAFLPGEASGRRLSTSGVARAILFPRVVQGSAAGLQRVGRADALKRLAPSTLIPLSFSPGAVLFNRIAHLVEQLPAWSIDLGGNMDEIAGQVSQLISDVA
jgi:hypothetical protein